FGLCMQKLGGTNIVMEHFDGEEFLALVERHGVTHTQVVPTMFIRMLKLDDDVRAKYDVSSLRGVVHAPAPCPIPLKGQMIEWWGPILHEYYAGTEGNGFVYTNSEDWLAHKGTVGRPLDAQVHILDEEGNEVPVGQEGTIYFGGGAEFSYHNDPEKTAGSHNEH